MTDPVITADGWTGYTPEDLAWFAENYGGTEWTVHVIGPDDVHAHANPDLDDDDPANPAFTQESALKFAADTNRFAREYAEKYPDPVGFRPVVLANVFRRGVPFEPAGEIDGQGQAAKTGRTGRRRAATSVSSLLPRRGR
jgi:hypothetical protein